MNKASLLFFFKVIMTGAIVMALSTTLDVTLLKQNLKKISYLTLSFSILSILIGFVFTTKRWQEIIACDFARLPFRQLWRQSMAGAFLNQCLPGSVSGDVYRGFVVKQYGIPNEWAINSTLLDRIFGLTSLVFSGILALPFVAQRLSQTQLGWTIISLLLLMGGGFIILIGLAKYSVHKEFALSLTKSPKNLLVVFCRRLYSTLTQGKQTIIIILCSLMGTVALVIPLYLVAQEMQLPLLLPQLLVCLPAVFLLSVLPISFAGWGIREGTMVLILGLFGISKEQAFCLSVLFGLVQLIAALPGALLLLLPSPPYLSKSA